MHPSIMALLDLNQVHGQRQMLLDDRNRRLARLEKAEADIARFRQAAQQAQQAVDDMAALITQYTADVERCEATITDLRSRQMQATNNKEYLQIINGVEEARSEMATRKASLESLNGKVEEHRQTSEQAKQRLASMEERYRAFVEKNTPSADVEASIAQLDKLYEEKRKLVAPEFLEVYERLVKSGNSMPLVPIDPVTRSTPLGQVASHNQLEQLRNGSLVQDAMTNGILYIKEG